MSTRWTPGPWYVRDFRACEMRRLGWAGPQIDRILITNKTGPEIEASSGADCVIARIQFDNRPDELDDGNLADATLIAAAPELYDALRKLVANVLAWRLPCHTVDVAEAALRRARGEQP